MTARQPDDRETLRVQMQQSIETVRHLSGLFVQAIGFFTASDVLLLGYGLTQRKAGAILVAAIMPLAVVYAQSLIYRHAIPIGYVAMRCEQKLAPDDATLATTYLQTRSPSIYARLESMIDMDQETQLRTLRSIRGPSLWSPLNRWYVAGSLAQFVTFLLAQTLFHYHFI